jgi:hypothetical protein
MAARGRLPGSDNGVTRTVVSTDTGLPACSGISVIQLLRWASLGDSHCQKSISMPRPGRSVACIWYGRMSMLFW